MRSASSGVAMFDGLFDFGPHPLEPIDQLGAVRRAMFLLDFDVHVGFLPLSPPRERGGR
jgi:hypothetical protein